MLLEEVTQVAGIVVSRQSLRYRIPVPDDSAEKFTKPHKTGQHW